MALDLIERVRLVSRVARAEVGLLLDHQFGQIGFIEGFNASCERLVGENDHRGAKFAGNAAGFDGDVEAVFDIFRGEDDARAIAVATVDGLE